MLCTAALRRHLTHVLILCAAPVASELILSILGLFWRPNVKIVSALQHLAAGVITAAVAAELVPLVLTSFKREALDYVAVVGGFLIAVIGFALLSHFLPEQCDDDDDDDECSSKENKKTKSCDKKDKCGVSQNEKKKLQQQQLDGTVDRETTPLVSSSPAINAAAGHTTISFSAQLSRLPWLMIAPLAVDTFLDGLLLALADIAEPHAGIIVGVAFAVETAVLGAMTSATLRHKHIPSAIILLVSLVLCLLFIVGAIIGATSVSFASGTLFLAFLSFGVASLLYLVVDHLLMEAREKRSAVIWLTRVQFYVGFLVVFVVHMATE